MSSCWSEAQVLSSKNQVGLANGPWPILGIRHLGVWSNISVESESSLWGILVPGFLRSFFANSADTPCALLHAGHCAEQCSEYILLILTAPQ